MADRALATALLRSRVLSVLVSRGIPTAIGGARQDVGRMPCPAAQIEHTRPSRQPRSQPADSADEPVDQLLVVDSPPQIAGIRARRREMRREHRVRQAAAIAEAPLQLR
jgi:hypothetical protein